uniref:Ubiquitin-specific protease 13 n=1 Tax=Tanacetum cinerariifolium TaxID=118510 RepID=A0A699I7J8_TANCI|nr:ubiquitin-specific protease 13 [Tanacetum cinerariifolium]
MKVVRKSNKRKHVSESDSFSSKEEKVLKKDYKGKKKNATSESDSESRNERAKNRGKKMKVVRKSNKRKHVSESDSFSSKEEKVLKVKKNSKKKKKQVYDSSSSFKEEKPLKKKKKHAKKGKDAQKKKEKPPTSARIKKEKYLSRFQILRSRTVPYTLPSRLARFVVTAFTVSTYEFMLEKGIIRVTPEKLHEILKVPLGGTSIFHLPERHLDDDFVKMWFKQFDPKPLKDICATDIAENLIKEKLKIIYDEKAELEDLLRKANTQFS